MINEVWKKKTTQNGAPFVSFYDMRAVTFVLPEEMEEVLMAALPWFILIRLNHMGSHRPNDSRSKPYLHREKKIEYLDQDSTNLLQSYELRGKQSFVFYISRLLRHGIEKGRGPILYTKNHGTPRGVMLGTLHRGIYQNPLCKSRGHM